MSNPIYNLYRNPVPAATPAGGVSDPSSKIHNYDHASRLFVDANYQYAPKYAYLFHVKFDFDPTYQAPNTNDAKLTAGMLVKSVALPKFSVENKIMNAYNRPNIVQNKIKYDPVNISFHDDNADAVLGMWKDYYTYYYRDADYVGNSDALAPEYTMEHKYANKRQTNNWGYTIRNSGNKQHILNAIRIYSLHSGKFTEYVLINPVITSFQHGEHRTGENNTLEHSMTVSYESIKYYFGTTSQNTVPGFADLHYDKSQSPILSGGLAKTNGNYHARNRPFGARGILGAGGILETGEQVFDDIQSGNFGQAAVKAWKSYNNNKNANFGKIAKSEVTGIATAVLVGAILKPNPNSNMSVPTARRIAQGSQEYSLSDQGLGINNSNLSGVPGIKVTDKIYKNFNNKTPSNGIVSNGASVASAAEATAPFSDRPALPLDNADGTVVTKTETYNDPYVMTAANDTQAEDASNQDTAFG